MSLRNSDLQDRSTLTLQRVTKRTRCPICEHGDWCELRSDGAVHCMRVESLIPCNRGGGWWHRFPDQVPFDLSSRVPHNKDSADVGRIAPAPGVTTAAPVQLDAVYRSLLSLCPLSNDHAAYLCREAIPEDQREGYGTLPESRTRIGAALLKLHSSEVLNRVPGLHSRGDGSLSILAPAGLLVAVRNLEGQIIALQVRVTGDNGSKRYIWLSSASKGGVGSGAPAHVAAGSHELVWLTEGAKKAHVVAARLGQTAIGLSGHTAHENGLAALRALVKHGALCVVIALDEDESETTALAVDRSRKKLARAALSLGLAVRYARWDARTAKGIDDLLRADRYPELHLVTAPPDDGPVGVPSGGGSCSCESSKTLAVLRTLFSGPLPDTEKLTMCGLSLLLGPVQAPLQHVYLDSVVDAVGLTSTRSRETARKRAGQALLNCAEWGLIQRDASDRDPASDHVRLQFAYDPAALPRAGTSLPVPQRMRQERDRKRACKHCGSTNLVLRCADCGSIQDSPLADVFTPGVTTTMDDGAPRIISFRSQLEQEAGGLFPESGSSYIQQNLFPDSGNSPLQSEMTGIGSSGDNETPSSDEETSGLLRSPLEVIVDMLDNAGVPVPLDWIGPATGLSREEVHTAITIGLRAKKLQEAPPRKGYRGTCYAAVQK